MATPHRKAIIVGISGASSSGKTTLTRLLRDIFPSTFILHEDDFYKPEEELPIRDGLVDWDCPEAISVPGMSRSLAHIRATGTLPVSRNHRLSCRADHGCDADPLPAPAPDSVPVDADPSLTLAPSRLQPDLASKEDRNSVGACPVQPATIEAQKERVRAWAAPGGAGHGVFDPGLKVCLLDGFLLYCSQMEDVMDFIDIKMFLRVSRAKATQRREARDGYVTLEGFWEDPPGYVDKIVWPNYVEAHKGLFEKGDVEGPMDREVLAEKAIHALADRDPDADMETLLKWAVETLIQKLPECAGTQ